MKVLKRNAVVIAVLLFVCTAVYLNWRYNKNEADIETDAPVTDGASEVTEDLDGDISESGLYFEEESSANAESTSDQYFAEVRLARQQARDEATETLQLISDTEGAEEAAISDAVSRMSRIADWTVAEAEIEGIIKAKGFEDCVVYMTDDGVTVTVAVGADGLSSAGAAQITEVITSETDYGTDNLTIIEIK